LKIAAQTRTHLFQGSKILGKQSLRALPIIGWCWYFTESIFLRRVWSTDKAVLEHDIQQLVDNYPENYNFTVNVSRLFVCLMIRVSFFFFDSNSCFYRVKALDTPKRNVLKV